MCDVSMYKTISSKTFFNNRRSQCCLGCGCQAYFFYEVDVCLVDSVSKNEVGMFHGVLCFDSRNRHSRNTLEAELARDDYSSSLLNLRCNTLAPRYNVYRFESSSSMFKTNEVMLVCLECYAFF